MTPAKSYRRGYAVAALVGIKDNQAVLWKVFTHVVKPEKTIPLVGTRGDSKAVYNFHEAIVNALRPSMKEGVKSIIVASPPRTSYGSEFIQHIRDHHAWLTQGPNKATFAEMTGTANTASEVTVLTRAPEFRKVIGETAAEETENLLELLEKRLNTAGSVPLVLYSLEEAEAAILGAWVPGKPVPEILLLTDSYLAASRQKYRVQRLTQVAANRGVKARVVSADSAAGKRIMQLGGIICIMKPNAG